MAMSQQQKTIRIIITVILITFYLLLLGINQRRNEIFDDAFITYRYASNFAEGKGLVYNEGESVLGTTTPGYALMLSAFAVVFGSDAIPTASLWINLFAMIGFMICMSIAAYKLSNHSYYIALLTPLLAFGSLATIDVIIWGMEGAVLLLLIGASITCIIYRRWLWACILAGLTIWIRPEGVFLIALLGLSIFGLSVMKQMKWREFFINATTLMLPSVLYFAMLIIFYNTFLPQSIVSKAGGLYPAEPFHQVNFILQYVISPLIFFLDLFFRDNNPIMTNPMVFIGMIPVALFFLIVGSMQLIKLDRMLWIVPVLLLINVLFYASSSTLIFPWYHSNYHIFVIILFALGIGQVIYAILSAFSLKHVVHISAILSLLLVCIPNILTTPYPTYAQTPRQRHYVSVHFLDYHNLVQAVGDDIPANAVIALHEIGYIGFYMRDNYILDTAGLVSPEITEYFPIPLEERDNNPLQGVIASEIIYDYQPDVIITLDNFIQYGLLRADWFDELYSIEYSITDVLAFDELMDLDVIVHRDRLDEIELDPDN